ncbi:MAG: EAL domain-containing protein [Actinomycetota bacterium]|nr:EAL domain-containing protein [Actinomycetota bacterium]
MGDAAARHPVLARQLRRLGIDPRHPPDDPQVWAALLERVGAAYEDADAERYTLERSIEISSKEMAALHATLSAREQFVATVLEHAPDGIVTTDEHGVVRSFNAAAERLFGWDSEEVVGRPAIDLVPPGLRDRYRRALTTHGASGPATGVTGEALEVPGLRRDGSTFPMRLAVASTRVGDEQMFIANLRDVSDRRALEDALAHQATHDGLTGLPNRTELLARLDDALDHAGSGAGDVAILFIDLDRFKVVNDSLGHRAGDLLLVEVARRLGAVVRADDVVARLGGDEFVVLCSRVTDRAAVDEVAERICEALAEPVSLDGADAYVSVSVGIAWAGSNADADRMLRAADLAMYRAKGTGRNRVVVFDRAMQAWADERLATETALRHAIADDELEVRYQPLVELATGRVLGAEALVRWNRPGVGVVAPGEFLPVAIETGLVADIGAVVLDDACRQLAAWLRDAPERDLHVSVNVSRREMAGPGLADRVSETLARHRLAPDRLRLELTEEVLLDDDEIVATTLRDLRRLGIVLAVDDFGTGWSSLSHLRRMPATVLKLDHTFVEDIDRVPATRVIVASVVSMAHALGMAVVAEGVEHASQARELARLGCDAAQGRHLGPPAGAADLRARLGAPAPISGAGSGGPEAPAR